MYVKLFSNHLKEKRELSPYGILVNSKKYLPLHKSEKTKFLKIKCYRKTANHPQILVSTWSFFKLDKNKWNGIQTDRRKFTNSICHDNTLPRYEIFSLAAHRPKHHVVKAEVCPDNLPLCPVVTSAPEWRESTRNHHEEQHPYAPHVRRRACKSTFHDLRSHELQGPHHVALHLIHAAQLTGQTKVYQPDNRRNIIQMCNTLDIFT